MNARAVSKSGSVTPVIFSLARAAMRAGASTTCRSKGMSLVGTYRAQFNKIIRVSSYDELVSRLEAKTRADAQASGATEVGAPVKP